MSKPVLVFKKELPRGQFCVYQSRPDFDLVKVKQTHSSIVLNEKKCHELEADGIVGDNSSAVSLAILTADCLPILLLGDNEHAFIHAGWRGLHSKILGNQVIKKINPYYAFIGPHISALHYEVQPDFKENFSNKKSFHEQDGKIFFDLAIEARTQLNEFYPGIIVDESGICTFSNEDFHSYRQNNTTERNWNIYRT